MKIWKKNMVAAALLAVVCVGIYANWSHTSKAIPVDLTETLDADKLLNDDMLVMALEDTAVETADTSANYFAAVRMSRQKARDSAVSLLQEAMAYTDAENTTTSSSELQSLVDTALCESQIENLVMAKGYKDCVAYMAEGGISVAVAAPEGGLQQEDVAVVADIVITQANCKMDDIHVVEVQ